LGFNPLCFCFFMLNMFSAMPAVLLEFELFRCILFILSC
jgi:hypothetical protein